MRLNSKMATRTLLLNFLLLVTAHLFAATAAFELLVVDADTMVPIQGVDVVGWFSNNNGWKAWAESAPESLDSKTTDENGRCRLKGKTNTGKTGVNIHNPPSGYYPNSFCVRHTFTQKPLLPLLHWRPTDLVITAGLFKIERPIPLFVRRTVLGNGQPISERVHGSFAYDLLKAAWLPPIGNGEHADMVFERLPRQMFGKVSNPHVNACSYKDTIVVRFEGDGNGIMEMAPMPNTPFMIRTAPVSGYGKSYKIWHSIDDAYQHQESRDENRHFCFRIRTRKNEKGEIIEAYYGKIYGDIGTVADKKNLYGVTFLYYLNLRPNDRNLEWDMKNNLCPNSGNVEMMVNHSPMVLP